MNVLVGWLSLDKRYSRLS